MGRRPGSLLTCGVALLLAWLAPVAASRAASGFVPAETLPATGAAASVVQTAMAPNGFAIAAWVESIDATHSAIGVATRPPGGPWSTPQQLDPTTLSQSRYPVSVAIDNAGDAAVAWDDEQFGSPTTDTAAAATRAAGQAGFGAPQKLSGAADPVVGIDSSGHVTMIDGELDGANNDLVDRVWPAGGAPPTIPTDLVATGCRPELQSSVMAVAPSGDGIAGAECAGDTFIRRIGGSWKPKTTPVSDFSNPGNCAAFVPPTAITSQAITVGIDPAGDVAGAFVVDNSTTDCTTFTQSNSYTLDLVVGAATGVVVVTPAVDTASSLDIATGSSITAPAIAVAPGSEALVWRKGSLISTTDDARFFDGAGNPSGPTQPLATTPFNSPIGVAMDPRGDALAVFSTMDGTALQAATRAPGTASFSAPIALAPAHSQAAAVAMDGAGDGIVGYLSGQGASSVAQVRGFDANAPSIDAASIPSATSVGAPATFTAQASDVWGPVTLSWNFGDGSAAATGTTVTHAFSTAATRTVTVTATDAIGNTATRTGTITVANRAPVLSKASIKPKRFRAGHKAVFTFTLNERAKVSITLAASKRRRHRKHHLKAAGKLTLNGLAGVNHVPFTGRIGRRGLAPGPYRATIVAAEGSAQSKPARLSFTILPAG